MSRYMFLILKSFLEKEPFSVPGLSAAVYLPTAKPWAVRVYLFGGRKDEELERGSVVVAAPKEGIWSVWVYNAKKSNWFFAIFTPAALAAALSNPPLSLV